MAQSKGFLSISVSDNAPLVRVYRGLTPELQRRALQASIYAAALVLQKAVRAAAPLGTEPTRKTRRVGTEFRGKGMDRKRFKLETPKSVAYDYGHLRENIARKRGREKDRGEVVIGNGAAFWANFLERGTGRMHAKPFFFAAIQSAKPAFLARLAQELEKNVEAAALRLGGIRAPVGRISR